MFGEARGCVVAGLDSQTIDGVGKPMIPDRWAALRSRLATDPHAVVATSRVLLWIEQIERALPAAVNFPIRGPSTRIPANAAQPPTE